MKKFFQILTLWKISDFLLVLVSPNSSTYPECFHSGLEHIHSVPDWIHTFPEYIHSTFLIVLKKYFSTLYFSIWSQTSSSLSLQMMHSGCRNSNVILRRLNSSKYNIPRPKPGIKIQIWNYEIQIFDFITLTLDERK